MKGATSSLHHQLFVSLEGNHHHHQKNEEKERSKPQPQ